MSQVDLFTGITPAPKRTIHDVHLLAGRCRIAVTRNGEGGIETIERLAASSPQRAQIIDAVIGGIARKSLDEVSLQTLAMLDFCHELKRIRDER